jgi:hypothetical protein
MKRNANGSAVVLLKDDVTACLPSHFKPKTLQSGNDVSRSQRRHPAHERLHQYPLNADKFRNVGNNAVFVFKTKANNVFHVVDQFFEGFALTITGSQLCDFANVKSVFIFFYDDVKFPLAHSALS